MVVHRHTWRAMRITQPNVSTCIQITCKLGEVVSLKIMVPRLMCKSAESKTTAMVHYFMYDGRMRTSRPLVYIIDHS